MLAFMAILSGMIIAFTVVQNGDLSLYMGNFQATALVHAVGLAAILLWLFIRREKFLWKRETPWYAYFGGVMGVLTVLGCNLSFAKLGVSVAVAVMLLGQTLMGVAVDQFGLFGAEKRPFKPAHAISLSLIIGGVAVMMVW